MLDILLAPITDSLWEEAGSPVVSLIGMLVQRVSSSVGLVLAWVCCFFVYGYALVVRPVQAEHRFIMYCFAAVCPSIAIVMTLAWCQNRLSSSRRSGSDA